VVADGVELVDDASDDDELMTSRDIHCVCICQSTCFSTNQRLYRHPQSANQSQVSAVTCPLDATRQEMVLDLRCDAVSVDSDGRHTTATSQQHTSNTHPTPYSRMTLHSSCHSFFPMGGGGENNQL